MTRVFLPHVITDDSALGGRSIERSVRFNTTDSTEFFNNSLGTNMTGNRQICTISIWFKRVDEASGGMIEYGYGGYQSSAYGGGLKWDGSGRFFVTQEVSNSTTWKVATTRVFRDYNTWYHLVVAVDTTQATASNRVKIYINGVQETSFSTETYPSENYSSNNLGYNKCRIGASNGYSDARYYSGWNGYLAEYHFIDGQYLDPTYFGYTEGQTGIWRPKKVTGVTYGNNGHYLDFKDNTSTTTLGYDRSGNGLHFSNNNLSVASGVGNDSMKDTPSHNYATLNSVHWNVLYGAGGTGNGADFTNGNLRFVSPSDVTSPYNRATSSTISVDSGKWYFEATQEHSDNGVTIGFSEVDAIDSNGYYTGSWGFNPFDQRYMIDGTETSYGAKASNGDVCGFAFDLDNNTMQLFINNSGQGVVTGLGISGKTVVMTAKIAFWTNKWVFNFGQQGFAYTPPTGYKALESTNIPPIAPSVVRPQRHFGTVLYEGNGGSSQTISGLEFKPDLLFFKGRNHAAAGVWIDSVRGVTKNLRSNSNAQEGTTTAFLESFNLDGFTVGQSGTTNGSSETNVAWCWKAGGAAVSNTDGNITTSCSANQEAGFSIITYTGTGAQTTVGHGLGKAPKVMITKLRDTTTQDWFFNPGEITGTRGKYIKFNTTDAEATDAHTYPDVAATSTVYTIGGDDGGNGTNGNGYAYVAYCWSEIPGYSKFGTYIGNYNSNGPYIQLGFRPAWVLIRRQAGDHWIIKDSTRNTTNDVYSNLLVNSDVVEFGSAGNVQSVDFLSNGFKIKGTDSGVNASTGTFIYMAFAEQPGFTPFGTFPNPR